MGTVVGLRRLYVKALGLVRRLSEEAGYDLHTVPAGDFEILGSRLGVAVTVRVSLGLVGSVGYGLGFWAYVVDAATAPAAGMGNRSFDILLGSRD